MNTLTKTMSTSTKNMVAMAEHTLGAMIGIFIILGQFNKSFDKDLWLYMVIFLPIFTGSFVFKSEEENSPYLITRSMYEQLLQSLFTQHLRVSGYSTHTAGISSSEHQLHH